jgi:Multimeric flavodoxin WrbA
VKYVQISVIFGSHRLGGTNHEIEKMLRKYSDIHEFDFIHLANNKIEGCTSCIQCGKLGQCVLPQSEDDHFQEIYDKIIVADVVFIITPVYAVIPSRLTALFERLTSVLFFTGAINTDSNPLLNKKVAIFNYCSNKICDDSEIKLIFDKFVMKNYRYDKSTYEYLNACDNPNEKYTNIIDYVEDTIVNLF